MLRTCFIAASAAILMPALAFAQATVASPADAGAMAAHHMGAHSAAAVFTVGDLELAGGFTRATLPNAPVGGGFLTITNHGTADDRLLSASSPIAADTQIHEMKMEGDVMKMTELPDGLLIPAGETVTLSPGGFHLMFMSLNQALVEGTEVPVTLTFEHAGTIDIALGVAGISADAPGGHH